MIRDVDKKKGVRGTPSEGETSVASLMIAWERERPRTLSTQCVVAPTLSVGVVTLTNVGTRIDPVRGNANAKRGRGNTNERGNAGVGTRTIAC